jgi:hypothetical protein
MADQTPAPNDSSLVKTLKELAAVLVLISTLVTSIIAAIHSAGAKDQSVQNSNEIAIVQKTADNAAIGAEDVKSALAVTDAKVTVAKTALANQVADVRAVTGSVLTSKLKEIAELRRKIATASGDPSDDTAATLAEKALADHLAAEKKVEQKVAPK